MQVVTLRDFVSWRRHARSLLRKDVAPEQVAWQSDHAPALDFGAAGGASEDVKTVTRIPRKLLVLLEKCALHRASAKWSLMYRVLWRVVRCGESRLLDDEADSDMQRLVAMAGAVSRDIHRMHAFLRFGTFPAPDGELHYAAWYEPEHHILREAATFFVERFASMKWSIVTPDGAVRWDGERLEFLDSAPLRLGGVSDTTESLWRTYYESVFNPARLNVRLMQRDMPRRVWSGLPELRGVHELIRQAPQRVNGMNHARTTPPRWSARAGARIAAAEPPTSISLADSIKSCRRCPLWEHATQGVCGQGPQPAALMLVGEQPGDEEDLQGAPFVGPAGRILNRALEAAGITRDSVYVTNAVKHFKWEPRGKRRLHRTPAQREFEACAGWLTHEIANVAPQVIVALGASAVRTLTGSRTALSDIRGEVLSHASGALLLPTYHPSAVLRSTDNGEHYYQSLCDDLREAGRLAAYSVRPEPVEGRTEIAIEREP